MRTLPSPIRLAATGLLVAAAVSVVWGVLAPGAGAQQSCPDGCVDVVAVDGIIDEIEADFIIGSVRSANRAGDVVAVVLQMDSPGAAVDDVRLNELASVIANSRVPVSVWIGAAGASRAAVAPQSSCRWPIRRASPPVPG
ncbi:MAG: hypothetical protein V9E94_15345 [Microthrixaceae bacterium]